MRYERKLTEETEIKTQKPERSQYSQFAAALFSQSGFHELILDSSIRPLSSSQTMTDINITLFYRKTRSFPIDPGYGNLFLRLIFAFFISVRHFTFFFGTQEEHLRDSLAGINFPRERIGIDDGYGHKSFLPIPAQMA